MGSDSQTSKPDPGISSPSIPSSPNPDSTNNAAETSSRATRFLENDPARTGYDPSVKWFMNYFKILTNKMTPEGMHHYREDRYRRHEKRDCEQCEKYRDWLFAHSPTVRFLREKIEALNGNLDESNVICRRCPAHIREDGTVVRQTGGFSPRHGILLCANEVRNRGHLEDTLSHEMVHAYDHVRWRMDWTGDKQLRHAACTEIRAAMLSGECRWTKEALTRGNWSLSQQFQQCVRRRAVQSVMARPACKDDVHAVKVVNEVWDSCFSDTRPFNEIYR